MDIRNRMGMLVAAIALLLPIALTSCGGGGGLAGGGTGGTGVGPVTGFGSVIVNGIHYDDRGIDNSSFFDDHGRTKAELKAGMMVKITATGVDDVAGTGTASEIEMLRHVDGPLDDNGVTLATRRMKVMGQTVLTDITTVFDNVIDLAGIDNLARAGKRPELEIHGIADDAGAIHATFVHKWADDRIAARDVQVRGTVVGLNPAHTVFTLGIVTVNVSTPPVGLANGQFVEAKGTFRVADNTLVATAVTIEDPAVGQSAGDLVKIEGYVNRIIGATQFELAGPDGLQRINWTTATVAFRDGLAADLVAGARIEVEGKRNLDKSVAAAEISFRKPSNVRLESVVSFPSLSPPNSMSLFGKTVFVNSLTQYKDGRSGLATFGFADILAGDSLRVSAFQDNSTGTTRIVASRVERINALAIDRHILQGVVDATDGASSVTILGTPGIFGPPGITVVTLPGTTEFLQADGTPFPGATADDRQANFLAAVTNGVTVVRARGPIASPTTPMNPANEVQIEPAVEN